jgi:hypothetical protein
MKAILAVCFVLLAVTGCSRRVEVQTGPQPTSEVALRVTNNSNQAVNVYVVTGGTDIFVGQVSANSTQLLNVAGVASGTVVSLRARPVSGGDGWRRDNVSLSGETTWQVP